MTRRAGWRGRRIALALAAALLALAGGWYWGSPWWTLWRVREAARAGDLERLAAYVDYEAMLERGRSDLRAAVASVRATMRPDTPEGRRFIALVESQAAMPDPPRDAAMEELRPWLANLELRPVSFGGDRYRPWVARYGLGRFEVRQQGADWETGPVLTFRREGLGWRLMEARWGQQ